MTWEQYEDFDPKAWPELRTGVAAPAPYIATRTVRRWMLLETFAMGLADRRVEFRLQPRSENVDGRFYFGSGLVALDPQRERFDGVEVWRARWRVERMPDWEGLPGMHALYQLVHESGPWFIDQPLYLHVPLRVGAPTPPKLAELTVRDLEQMRMRQRGG